MFATDTELLRIVKLLLRTKTYLEIGVETGYSLFDLPLPEEIVGVDPALHVIAPDLPSTTVSLFEMTSDAFFARNASEGLNRNPVDATFVDGMHLAEYAWRDIVNAERVSNAGGAILVHDIFPKTPEQAGRTQCPGFWMGDVFKVLPALKRFRPDLTVVCLRDVPPSGMAVVTGPNLSSPPTVSRSEVEAYLEHISFEGDFAHTIEPMMVETGSADFIELLNRLATRAA